MERHELKEKLAGTREQIDGFKLLVPEAWLGAGTEGPIDPLVADDRVEAAPTTFDAAAYKALDPP